VIDIIGFYQKALNPLMKDLALDGLVVWFCPPEHMIVETYLHIYNKEIRTFIKTRCPTAADLTFIKELRHEVIDAVSKSRADYHQKLIHQGNDYD